MGATLRDFESADTIALDFETSESEGDFRTEVDLVGLAMKKKSKTISASFEADKLPEIYKLLQNKRIVAHNVKFELEVLHNNNFDVTQLKFEDSMIQAHLLDENAPKDLKSLRVSVLGKEKRAGWSEINRLDRKEYMKYNREDAEDSLELYEKQKKFITDEKLDTVYLIEIGTVLPIVEMETTGCVIDLALREKQEKMLKGFLKDLQVQIDIGAGKPMNLNSPAQLQELFFVILGIPPRDTWKTKTGYSTGIEVLDKLEFLYNRPGEDKNIYEIVKSIKECRKYNKVLSAFVGEAMLSKLKNGRVYGNFHAQGTSTGRFAASNPNLQQVPAEPFIKGDMDTHIRSLFIAPEGQVFLTADYSQIELVLMAELSKDSRMTQAFLDGEDLHQKTADSIGCSRMEGKILNFAVGYGMGPQGFADRTGMDQEKAKAYIQNFFDTYSGISRKINEIRKRARDQGFIRTISGRKRRFTEMLDRGDIASDKAVDRLSFNSLIQGSCADLMKIAMIRIYRNIDHKRAKFIMTVHDEISFYADEDYMEDAYHIVKFEMESALKTVIPFKADVALGRRWSDNK